MSEAASVAIDLSALSVGVYLVGVGVALYATDARPAARLGLALLWPLGPLAFVVTITVLLLASLIAFPIVGVIVLLVALAAVLVLAAPASADDLIRQASAPPAPSGLQRMLEADLARFPAKAGIYVKHLKTGEEAAVQADEPFNSASVIKIPIMTLAYELAERRALNLDGRIEVRKSDFRAGSGVLRYHDPGLRPTVRDLITQMIITSDNTATDMVIAQVGGVGRVNEWLASNGYNELRLNGTIFDVFRRRYASVDASLAKLTPEELYGLQSGDAGFAPMATERFDRIVAALRRPGVPEELNRQIHEEPSTWFGQITARAVGRLLEAIERCTLPGKSGCTEMTRAFRRQQAGTRRLPHFVDVPVGHKTGDFPPVLANDVGVIYARSGSIVIVFLTNAIREPYAEAEDRMGRTTRAIVDYFDGPTAR